MSTRGAYGFKINNQEKILFSQYDSNLESLGKEIVEFLNSGLDLKRLREKVKNLNVVPKEYEKRSLLANSSLWDHPSQVLRSIYLGICNQYFDAQEFTEDMLFCEYFYLIDLDANKLIIHQLGRSLVVASFPLPVPKKWLSLAQAGIKKQDHLKNLYLNRLMGNQVKKSKKP